MKIKVNKAQWDGLSQSEKDNITQIVTGQFKGASIVPDSATPPVDPGKISFGCKILCDIAETSAIAACSLLSPLAIPVCVAVAHAAGEACRNSC